MTTTRIILVKRVNQSIVGSLSTKPHALNALNIELLNSLCDTLRTNAKAQIIVPEGAGDRLFCVGEDFEQTLALKTGFAEELRLSLQKLQGLTGL